MPITSSSMGRTHRRRQRRLWELEEAAVAAAENNDLPPIQWLPGLLKQLHNRGWYNPRRLVVRQFGNSGRGLCSKRYAFKVGDELIRMPFDCLISMATLEQDAGFRGIFNPNKLRKRDKAVSTHAWLAFYLLFQKHRRDNPLVRSYLRTLPDTFMAPFFCPLNEIKSMPEFIIKYVLNQNFNIRRNYDTLSTMIVRARCACCSRDQLDIFDYNEFKWAWFVVNTRSVYVDVLNNSAELLPAQRRFDTVTKDVPNMALAPFLDMFNHSDQIGTKASLVFNKSVERLELVIKMTANHKDKPPIIRPHSQLFISYGELNDFQLLMEYGIVLTENEHNFYAFDITDLEKFTANACIPKDIQFDSEKYRFLRQHGLEQNMYVHARGNGMSHNLHVALHLLFRVPNSNARRYAAAVYGDGTQLHNCSDVLRHLLHWRMDSLKFYIKELEPVTPLSVQGNLCVEYIQNTINFLQRICLMHLS